MVAAELPPRGASERELISVDSGLVCNTDNIDNDKLTI
jgi:hypothetical protein